MILTLLLASALSYIAYDVSFLRVEPVAAAYARQFIDEVGVPPYRSLRRIQYTEFSTLCRPVVMSMLLEKETCVKAHSGRSIGVAYSLPRWRWEFPKVAIDMDKNYLYDEELLLHELSHALYKVKHTGEEGGPENNLIMRAVRNKAPLPPPILLLEKKKLIDYIRRNR